MSSRSNRNRSNSTVRSHHRSHHRSHRRSHHRSHHHSNNNRDDSSLRNRRRSRSSSRNRPKRTPVIDISSTLSSQLSKNSKSIPIVNNPLINPSNNTSSAVPTTISQPTVQQPTSSSAQITGDSGVPLNKSSSDPQSTTLPVANSATDNSAVTQQESSEPSLVPEILEAMGKRLDSDNQRAPALHNDIVVRWEDIIKKGLPEEERKISSKNILLQKIVLFLNLQN